MERDGHGVCQPKATCDKAWMERDGHGVCQPKPCDKAWMERDGHGKCEPKPCEDGFQATHDGKCEPKPCEDGFQATHDGKCEPKPCEDGFQASHDGQCVPKCADDEVLSNGECVPDCDEGQSLVDGQCVPKCDLDPSDASCPPPPVECTTTQTLVDGVCKDNPPANPKFTQSANVHGQLDLCLADGTTDTVVNYSGAGTATSGISDADAIFMANEAANAAAAADIAAKTPGGASKGACGPVVSAAEAPVVIAAPKPATIPTKKPAKVHVAQPANVDAGVATVPTATIPSAVNAGGGSSGDHGPNAGLLLLALTATGVCLIATGRLLATRSR